MTNFASVEAALDFAIGKEIDARDFYTDLAGRMDRDDMKAVFIEFAREEDGHRAKLEAVKHGQQLKASERKIQDLKIGDYLIDVEARENMNYQEALILAMKAEKAAYRLYSDLAAQSDDAALQELFNGLAQEEAKHKLRFEREYDDNILTEN
jgi:rubrerythrin